MVKENVAMTSGKASNHPGRDLSHSDYGAVPKEPRSDSRRHQRADDVNPKTNESTNTAAGMATTREERQSQGRQQRSPVPYSVARVRFVVSLVSLLKNLGIPTSVNVVVQYLLHRWALEAGIALDTSGQESQCLTNVSDPSWQIKNEIHARVSIAGMYFTYCLAIPGLLTSLFLGAYSDVIGRKMTMCSPLIGDLLRMVLVICIIRFDLSTNLFYLASFVEGVFGSYFVFFIAMFSVAADIHPDKSQRILWMSLLTSLVYLIQAFTDLVAGYLIKYAGFLATSYFLTSPIVLNLILVVFFLPETRPEAADPTFNVWLNVKRMFHIYTSTGSLRRRLALVIALALFFISETGMLNIAAVTTLYQMHAPLCWDSSQVGWFNAMMLTGRALAVAILKFVQGCARRLSEESLAMAGMVFHAASFLLAAFSTSSWMMYLVPVLDIPGALSPPVVRGMMSLLVDSSNQGALFASISIMESLCNLLSATAFSRIYSATVSVMPGAVFIFIASLSIVCLVLFILFSYFYESPHAADTLSPNDEEDAKSVLVLEASLQTTNAKDR